MSSSARKSADRSSARVFLESVSVPRSSLEVPVGPSKRSLESRSLEKGPSKQGPSKEAPSKEAPSKEGPSRRSPSRMSLEKSLEQSIGILVIRPENV